jgi:hypothetical protein
MEVVKMEEVREYGEAVLVYERINGKEFVYSYELLQKFRNSTKWLIQVYRDYESDDEDEYYVNKIYRAKGGELWLQRTLVNENKPTEDVLQIYRIY